MRGITERHTGLHCMDREQRGADDGGREGYEKTRGEYMALLCLESHTKNNEMRKRKPSG